MKMTVKQKDEIIDILENLPYWDTCPQDYKDRIPELLKALSKVNNGVLDDVNGTCCENPKHATEVNDMFESWTYCKNCDKDII